MATPNDELLNPQEEQQGSEDLLKHWHAVMSHRWIVLTFVGVALVFSSIHQFRVPDRYRAVARVLIYNPGEAPEMPFSEVTGSTRKGWGDQVYSETQVQVIKSISVAKKVAQNLNLKEHYGVATDLQAAQALKARVEALLVQKTSIAVVSITDSDPEWAAKIANELTDAYVQEAMKDRMFVSEQILKWFPGGVPNAEDSNPMQLIRRMDNRDFAEKLPSIANDPGIRKLKDDKIALQARTQELLARYTPEHPQVKELNGRLEYLNGEIKLQTDKIIATIKTALAGEFSVSNIKVLERAVVPSAPAGPDRKRGILTVTLMGLAAGVSLAIFIESVDKTIRSDEDILGVAGLPFLGAVPFIDPGRRGRAKDPQNKSVGSLLDNSVIADAMTSLNTALMFSMPKGQNKLILVTSTIPGEGKTTVSYLLGRSAAALGNRVLHVEMDLRRPALRRRIGETEHHKGIAEYLVGQAGLEEIIHKDEKQPNLDVIFSGESSPNPTTLITSTAFEEFVKTVSERYNRVIFDTPPSLDIPDAVILSGKMHGVVFVIGAGMVHRKIALKTFRKFAFVGATVFGAVLNRVNYRRGAYGAGQYYYGKYYRKSGKYYN